MAQHQSPVEITYTTATADVVPLGYEFAELTSSGVKVWRWVQVTGSAAAIGDVLARAVTASTHVTRLAVSATDTRLAVSGIAQHAIDQDSYGFVQVKGLGTVATDGGVAAGGENLVIHTVAGQTDTFAAGEENLIVAQAIAADVGNVVTAWIDCA